MSKLDKPDGDAVTKKVGLQCEINLGPVAPRAPAS